ncbi:hypothetical protein KA036_02285, partial [Candidatus Gracilibacteria bacterium]|nr:hypothetical protein [Candidatus Gracilibacteria bacterium]
MLSLLPKWPSNLDLVEARLLQHGPNGPEIDRPDPSLPAEPRKPATAEDTKLDPETIGFDPSFGEYDAEGHSSL